MPRTIRRERFDAMLAAVYAELKRGRIFEGPIESPDGEVLDGCVDETNTIYIDPRPLLLETLIHETLHRAYPTWGERRICTTAHTVLMAMSDNERRALHARYRRVAKKRTRPVRLE